MVREEFDRRSLPANLAEEVTAAGGRSSGSARQILATDDSALSPPEALQTLWQQSRAEILAQAEAIADAVTDALTGSLSEAARVQATRHAHQLAGSVGTLGFAVASDHARTLEHALRAPAGPPSADLPRLAELAVALRRELEDDRHCEPADAVTASSQEPPELMVVAGADQEIDRVEVARRGGRGFLARSLEPSDTIAAALDLRERVRIHGTRVLVVDDDAIVLSLLESVLTEADIGVTTCQDPGHFWQRLGEVCPDLVLLDFEMPGISGPDLCRTLRNETRWAALPVVFLTARTDAESVRAVFDAGADDYLSKPFVGPEVIARIANRLERVRAACSRKPTASPACPTAAARRRRSRRSCAWPSASSSRPRSR